MSFREGTLGRGSRDFKCQWRAYTALRLSWHRYREVGVYICTLYIAVDFCIFVRIHRGLGAYCVYVSYIYMYICIYGCIHIFIYIYIYIDTHTYTCAGMHARTHTHTDIDT